MSSTRGWMAVAAIGWIGLASVGTLRAEDRRDVEVTYAIKPPDPGPKTKDDAPQIEAIVIGAPNLPADRFVLVDKSARPPVQIKAVAKRGVQQGSETLALAVVMLGWEMWIGNETYRPEDDPTRVPGALKAVQRAIDKLDLKAAGPPGSVGVVITYGTTAQVRLPMGPLGKLTGRALGSQQDYKNQTGLELVKGIELALAELRKVTSSRKALIVLTDGEDSNIAAAKSSLPALKKQARADGVQAFAIVYKAADSGPNNVIPQFTAQVATATTAENIEPALGQIMKRLTDRQYLTFPGFHKATKTGLAWDGKPHELVLQIGKDETEPQPVVLAPKWRP